MNFASRAALLAALGVTSLLADASFDESVRFTGGSVLEMMRNLASSPIGKLTGGRMGNAFQDQNYNVYLKGSKMARIGGTTSSITDLDAGTITTIDNNKHTYSVMTFDEMKEMMERMQQRASRGQNAPDLQFDVKVNPTGNTKTIDGKTAKEFILTMTATQSGANGAMTVKSDLWTVPDQPGSQEWRDYYKKLSTKYQGSIGGFNPMMGGASKGLAAAMSESMKLEGYPILNTTEVSGVASPMGPMGGGDNGNSSGPFIQIETHSSNFSTASVDDSKFVVPADYKQTKPRGAR
jgi:hypothetical protein